MTNTTIKTKLFSLIIVLTMLVSIMPFSEIVAYAADNSYETIALDEEKKVTLNGDTVTEKIFAFTPSESGEYAFYSYDSQYDTYGYICDENGQELEYNDDYGATSQFCVHYEMTAGTTYLLKAEFYNTDNIGSMNVKVIKKPAISSISFDVDILTYAVGNVLDLFYYYSVEPFASDRTSLVWESSDESIAYVDDENVHFCAPGTVTITLSDGDDVSDSITLTVLAPEDMAIDTEYIADHSTLDAVTYKFVPEEDGNYGFYAYDTDGQYMIVKVYDSNFLNIVNNSGYGDTSGCLYLNAGEIYYLVLDCEIGVDPYKTKVMRLGEATGVSLNYTSYDGTVGGGVQLKSIFPMGELPESVSWSSSDQTVAAVDPNGYVYFLEPGSVTITVTSISGFSASCEITVAQHVHEAQEWNRSENYHYSYCVCGEYIEAEHIFGSNNICEDCGYEYCEHTYTEYDCFEDYHSARCDICNAHIDEEHKYDASEKCVCGYFEHEHVFDTYDYDPTYHWTACSLCGMELSEDETYTHEYNADDVCECGRKHFTDGIYIGATLLRDGEYIDNDGNVSSFAPKNGHAYFKDGALTLNNFRIVNQDQNPIYDSSAIYSELDLELILVGNSYLEAVGDDVIYLAMADLTISGDGAIYIFSRRVFDGYGYYTGDGIDVNAGHLTVNSGTLCVDSSSSGFEIGGDIEINGGSFYIESDSDGIEADGDIIINGGFFDLYTDDDGIDADGAITINKGIFNFDSDCCAIYSNGGITFGAAMGEQNVVGDDGAFSWSDSNDNTIENGQLLPEDEDRTILEYDWIDESLKILVFNGEVQNPIGTVYNNDDKLILNVDYTVELSAEVKNIGTYFATVTGIGDYVGTYIVPFAVHKVYELKGDTDLKLNAESMVSDICSMVKFTALTDSEYTFAINMPSGYAHVIVYNDIFDYIDHHFDNNGEITFKLELEAGETVYFDVYTEREKSVFTEMSVEFICNEHNMDDGVVAIAPACETEGVITYTCEYGCGHSYNETIPALEHDYIRVARYYIECALCGEGVCDHMCHKDGLDALVWKIFEFIYDLFGIESECDCGEIH